MRPQQVKSKALYNRELILHDAVGFIISMKSNAMLAAVNLCIMMSCQVFALQREPHYVKSLLP
jgi:hypothetical protein